MDAEPVRAVLSKDQRWRSYPAERSARQVFIRVVRVARDGSWADISCHTFALEWRKRQPLRRGRLPFPAERFDWDRTDLYVQSMDRTAMRQDSPDGR